MARRQGPGAAPPGGPPAGGTADARRQRWARVPVQVYPQYRARLSSRWLREAVRAALLSGLRGDPPARPLRVGLVVADDATVRELNRTYRGLDAETDVLAFSPSHAGPFEGEGEPPSQEQVAFPSLPGAPLDLGEVVLSFPQAERQAAEAGRGVGDEVALLACHGVLHLLGYDHAEPGQEREMVELQAEALARLGGSSAWDRRDAP